MKTIFSIIIPIYNIEQYLRKSIESALNQSFNQIEIILVNDGSTDNSLKICKEYSKKDKRIVLIDKKNGGLSDARNAGLFVATGEYILFLDGDDFIDINTCELFHSKIKQNGDLDILTGNIKDAKLGLEKAEMIALNDLRVLDGYNYLKNQLLNKGFYISACRNVYRREYLISNDLKFKFGILHEDVQWTPRVFLSANKVLATDIVFYNRVIRKDSITRRKDKTQNALDLIETVNELSLIYANISDEELKKLLQNLLVTTFLSAFQMGKLYKRKYKHLIDKQFLLDNSFNRKTKAKVRLFIFSKRLYYMINKLHKAFMRLFRG